MLITESYEDLWRQFAYYSPEPSYQLDKQFACICPKQCTCGSLKNMCVLPLFDRRSLNSTESRGSVFSMMTRLRHGCPRNHVSILGRVKVFISCPKHPDLFCHPPCLLSVGTGASFFFPRSMELTIHFHRVSRSRMGGAVPPLSRTPSWRAHGQPDTRSISKPPFFPDINPFGFYNRDEKCLLRGTNWAFK